jgi:transposase
MAHHCDESMKKIIIKVREYFQQEKNSGLENIKINQVVQRTADCLGINTRTVKRVTSEERKSDAVSSAKERSGRPKLQCDEFLQGVIRRTILNFYLQRRFPTIKEVHQKLKEDINDLPEFSDMTLYRWVKQLNFSYKKLNNKPILMEQNAVAAKRAEFLYDIKRYRENFWQIFYTDETWCGANHSRKFGWVEKVDPTKRDNFDQYRGGIQEINGFRGGIKQPSGSGQRVIILHIGNEHGFLEGCLKCFIGKKNLASTDYHNEMNRQHYEEWFRTVLSVIPDKSVIVVDQAPYHTMLDPNFRNPTTAWTKQKVIEWMSKRQIILPDGVKSFDELTKPRLLDLCRNYHFPKTYLLDTITKEVRGGNVKLLWLPVAHCEFNAIELIWAYVKNKVAKLNTTFKVGDVLNLCLETMQTVPNTVWENCVEHAKKIEEKYREKDHLVDVVVEPLIINLDSSDDESNEDFSEDSENEV